MTHFRQQVRRAGALHQVTRFSTSVAIACIMCALAPQRSYAQTARTTANQGPAAHYGWQDPDGSADGYNWIALVATDDKTLPAESRIYNVVGDPISGANLPAYNNNYTLTFRLFASTPTLPPNNNSTITAYLTTEYSTNGGGSWFSVGGTSSVTATRSTPGVTTTVQAFTVTLSISGGAPVWIRLILRGTASGTLSGGAVRVYSYASTGDLYAITWSNTPGTPVVDVSPYNFDKQDYSRCASACFAATYAQSTVPYFSMDAPRSVTLAYNGDRVDPRAFVHVNVRPDPYYAGTPTEYQLQVKVNAALVTFVNGEQTLHFAYPGDTMRVRLGAQFSVNSYSTGVYPMNILVSALYGSTLITRDFVTTLTVVNETGSQVARGWTLPGIQKLYLQGDGSALITEGEGSAVYFKKQGSAFVSPAGEFSQLITSMLSGTSGWARVFSDSSKIVFDNTGKMVQIRDAFNNVDTVKYDASGRVTKVKDPLGLAITLAYGSNGLSSITDAGSPARVTIVTVNASNRLTAVQDPDGISTTFGYDASLRLATITSRNGKTITLGYDSQAGTLASLTGPTIPLYDGSNAAPAVTLAAWQKVGVPYTTTLGAPATPPTADTVRGSVTEPGGGVTRFTVNHWGTPAQSTDALSRITVVTHDKNGLPVRLAYPNGAVDSATYNASGLPTFVQTADGTNRRFITYNSGWGRADSAWGGPQPAFRAFVGQNGRLDSTRVAGQFKTRYTYGTTGRVVSIIDPNGYLVVKHWFAGVNANTSQDSVPGGWLTTYSYDAYGRDTAVNAPVTPARRTHYDLLNRPIQFYDGAYATPTILAYDSVGNLKVVTDAKGQTFGFTYNATGWLIAKTDPAGLADTLKYNRDGDLKTRRNRRGQSMSFTYDALHRLKTKSGTNTDTDLWGYSVDGRVDTSASPIATEITYRNVRGQVDSAKTLVGGQTFWRRYHFSSWGIEDTVVLTGGGIAFRPRSYSIDTTRFVLAGIRLGPPSAGATSMSYDANTNPTSLNYRGAPISRQYDMQNELGSITSTALFGDSVLRMLTYDGEGRITRQADQGGTHSRKFTYDSLGRLTSDIVQTIVGNPPSDCDGDPPPIQGSNGSNCLDYITWQTVSSEQFSYDSVGNRTDHSGGYGPGNRIQVFAGCTYLTDNDGNVTARRCPSDTVAFKWSAEGLLDTAIVGGLTLSYYYDGNGRLVRKDSAGVASRHFLWQGSNLLAELTGSATAERAEFSYFPGADNPHAIVFGGVEYDAQRDGIRNVVTLTDSAQAVRQGYGFEAWGGLQATGGDLSLSGADRMRFKGALFLGDEANLYYMRARWYEPKTGRFLSEDPLGLKGGLNPYVYAGDDPINNSDPMGTCTYYETWNDNTGPSGGVLYWVTYSPDCTQAAIASSSTSGAGPGERVERRHPARNQSVAPPPRHPSCNLSSILADARAGARITAHVGLYYGAIAGGIAGYTSGAVTGAVLGTFVMAPTGVGAVAGAVGGFIGGGYEGGFFGSLAGAGVGVVVGGVTGFTGGFVGAFVDKCGI